mmetsp:Transcript_97745/g.232764  ORF Transcript_97745/g.232764 Transcript_97745/m.232764 type:complete len:397 (+) Transcript_97745:540-1730(+)
MARLVCGHVLALAAVRIAGVTMQGDVVLLIQAVQALKLLLQQRAPRCLMHEAHQGVVHEDAGPALLVALVVRVLLQVVQHVVTQAVGLVVQRHGCLGVELQLLQVVRRLLQVRTLQEGAATVSLRLHAGMVHKVVQIKRPVVTLVHGVTLDGFCLNDGLNAGMAIVLPESQRILDHDAQGVRLTGVIAHGGQVLHFLGKVVHRSLADVDVLQDLLGVYLKLLLHQVMCSTASSHLHGRGHLILSNGLHSCGKLCFDDGLPLFGILLRLGILNLLLEAQQHALELDLVGLRDGQNVLRLGQLLLHHLLHSGDPVRAIGALHGAHVRHRGVQIHCRRRSNSRALHAPRTPAAPRSRHCVTLGVFEAQRGRIGNLVCDRIQDTRQDNPSNLGLLHFHSI